MKKENTSIRLKEIMNDRNLKQIEILELCEPYCKKLGVKLGRNDLSQYVNGKVEPGQKKLTILGLALNVNEAWLMGYDVPMSRDTYEDQNIITFDAKLDTAIKLLEEDGYTVSFSDDPKDDVITIINSDREPVSCMHEYELVNKYESLQRRGTITSGLLAETNLDLLDIQKEARKRFAMQWNLQFFENKLLKSFSQLNDDNKQKSILYTENLLSNQKMEDELTVQAAHARTDIEHTPEGQAHDDAIMDDDSEWE